MASASRSTVKLCVGDTGGHRRGYRLSLGHHAGQALAMAVAGVQVWQRVGGAWLAQSTSKSLWKIWEALTGTNLVGLAVVGIGVLVVRIRYPGPPLLATLTPWLAEFVGITVGVGAILGALGIIAGRSWAAKAPWGIATSGALGLGSGRYFGKSVPSAPAL